MDTGASQTLGQLILRLALGAILIVHGLQKLLVFTVEGVQSNFAMMGVPLPEITAYYQTWLEIIGGAAIVLGLFTRVISALVVLSMSAAVMYAHFNFGFFVDQGGWEFVMLIGAVAAALFFTGAGKLSLDRAFFGRNKPEVVEEVVEEFPTRRRRKA